MYGAEVVDGQPDPEAAEGSEHAFGSDRVAHDRTLGDLEQELPRIELPRAESVGDIFDEVWFGEVAGGEVDGDREVVPILFPLLALADGLGQHVPGQRLDERGSLGDRDELGGDEEAVARVLPPDERLDPRHLARLQVEYRLIVEDELAGVDRVAKPAEQAELRCVVVVLLGAVHRVAAVLVLGDVHRHVGSLDQQLDVFSVRRVERDPDARLDGDRDSLHEHRFLQRLLDLFDAADPARLPVRQAGHEDAEFVAAEPGHDVRCSHRALQPAGDLPQEIVSAVMPE